MDRDPLDMDMGDDEQADDVREYERYIEDPPKDLRIRNRENDDDGRLGIGDELEQEWSHRDGTDATDNRPAEAAAIEIVDDTSL